LKDTVFFYFDEKIPLKHT